MHTQALHILSNTFSCCKNSAHRSISSEMNSTYGMWTNPKTVRACQQKCTMIGGLLVGCWLAHTRTSPRCVAANEFEMCTLFIPDSRQLLTTNSAYSWHLMWVRARAPNAQTTRRHIDTCPEWISTFFVCTFDDIWEIEYEAQMQNCMQMQNWGWHYFYCMRSSCIEFSHRII